MARQTKQQIAEAAEAELKAAQQAELKRLRAAKAAATRAANKAAKENSEAKAAFLQRNPELATEEELKQFDPQVEDAQREARMASAFETLMSEFEVPSVRRWVTALTLAILAACGTGYMVGTLAGLVLVAAVSYTGMAWLGFMIYVLGIIAGGLLAGRVSGVVYAFVADKKIDAVYHSAKNKVTGWFTKPAIVQFSGAHTA